MWCGWERRGRPEVTQRVEVGGDGGVTLLEVSQAALVAAVERSGALVDDRAVLDRRCWLCGLLGGGGEGAVGLDAASATSEAAASTDGALLRARLGERLFG